MTSVAQTFLLFSMILIASHLDKATAHGFAALCLVIAVAFFIIDGVLK